MATLWRKIVQPKRNLTPDLMREKAHQSSKFSINSEYRESLDEVCSDSPERLVHSCRGMKLLRRVHLVDPIVSPSWSGTPRSQQPSILYLLEEKPADPSVNQEISEPGVIDIANGSSLLAVRGLLLDTIKHIGPVADQSGSKDHLPPPPKWLKKIALSAASPVLREVSLNVANGDAHNSVSKLKPNPQSILHEKYSDFVTAILSASQHQSPSKQSSKASNPFQNVKMCVTEAGYFGLVPPSAKVEDNIFMVERDALRSLFVVRRHPVHGFFLWNGLVYVRGLAEVVDNTYATDRILVG